MIIENITTETKIDDTEIKSKIKFPLRIGDLVEGIIIGLDQEGIYLDLDGLATGIIRGPELFDESGKFSNCKKGDKVLATVVDLENEKGSVELSFRYAGHKKAWSDLKEILQLKKIVLVKIVDANKGGLIAEYNNFQGFLPVSQLKPENYPRVKEGNKMEILEKLKTFINKELLVRIINIDETEKKIIFSEKQIKTEKEIKHKIGEVVEAKITGLANFGAFVTFNEDSEGLIHISELAWKRIEKPEEVVKVGETVEAKIINLTKDGKASLSTKALLEDPWKKINEKYQINQTVEGKILKINPFGLFVSLDENIHGLAHVSELLLKEGEKIETKFKEGETNLFKIISLEPEDHRLSLALME